MAASTLSARRAFVWVGEALVKIQSRAFNQFFTTVLLRITAVRLLVAFILVHAFAATTIFRFVVALLNTSHPCIFHAPSGNAIVPVVGRLGASPWHLRFDGGRSGMLNAGTARIYIIV